MSAELVRTTFWDRLHDAWMPCFLWGMLLAGPSVLACTLVNSPVARQRWMQAILTIWVGGSFALIARVPEFQVHQGVPQATWIGPIWVLGALFCILRFGVAAVRTLQPNGKEGLPDRQVWDWFRSERNKLSKKTVSIRVSNHLSGSVAACRHHTVLVSADFPGQMSESEARSILRHEIAHANSNHWIQWSIESIFFAILFWHPVAWWMSSVQAELREMECDDVAAKPDRLSYAEALLKVHSNRHSFRLAFTAACSARWQRLANSNSRTNPRQRVAASMATAFALLAAGWIAIPLFVSEQKVVLQALPPVVPASAKPKHVEVRWMTSSASSSSMSMASSWSAGSSMKNNSSAGTTSKMIRYGSN